MLRVNLLRRLGRIPKARYNIVKYPKIAAVCVGLWDRWRGGIVGRRRDLKN